MTDIAAEGRAALSMTSGRNRLSLTGGGRLVPAGYEWLVVAVFLASLALVLYVATRDRR